MFLAFRKVSKNTNKRLLLCQLCGKIIVGGKVVKSQLTTKFQSLAQSERLTPFDMEITLHNYLATWKSQHKKYKKYRKEDFCYDGFMWNLTNSSHSILYIFDYNYSDRQSRRRLNNMQDFISRHSIDSEIKNSSISRLVLNKTNSKCIDTIKFRKVEGDLAELGVYQGDFAQYFNKYLPERKLYLFDTFDGFDVKHDVVAPEDVNNFKNTSIEIVLSKMTCTENVIVKKGYFPVTTSDISNKIKFALVSLDCDLYEPMINGLNYFYEKLSAGGYIFVHDFGNRHYPGVKKAVFEFCNKKKISFVPIMDQYLSIIFTK